MYSYPTRLPQTTNREDLTFTVSIYDDDTNSPVLLSGIKILQNPNGISNNNWIVTDGQISTTSSTVFFTPGYPIGNQLLAVTFTVGLNLGILAGDPITITDVDGDVQLIGYVTSYTPATGTLVTQIGYNFQMEIRRWGRGRHFLDDYSPWYDWGGGPPPGSGATPTILATLGKGIMITDIGFLQVVIPVSLLQQLRHETYLVAMAMTDSVNTRQVFLGELPILYGGMQTWPWQQTLTAQTV